MFFPIRDDLDQGWAIIFDEGEHTKMLEIDQGPHSSMILMEEGQGRGCRLGAEGTLG